MYLFCPKTVYLLACLLAFDFQGVETARERGIETVCRFILCVSLLYRIVWVIAHQAKRTKIWPLPPRSRGYRSHQREGCDLAHLPEGRPKILRQTPMPPGPYP